MVSKLRTSYTIQNKVVKNLVSVGVHGGAQRLPAKRPCV